MRYIETIDVPVEQLDAFPGNARVHAENVLRQSARANGQYRAIVARRLEGGALEILAGHGTRDAFAATGAEVVRVEVIEADDAEAARIVLVDNRGNDLAGYDEAALLALLDSFDGELTGSGFNADDLAALGRQVDAARLGEVDAAAEWDAAGMPGYESDDLQGAYKVSISFVTEADANEFFRRIDRPKAKKMWWPASDGHVGLLSGSAVSADVA